jgi:hypothetical protein
MAHYEGEFKFGPQIGQQMEQAKGVRPTRYADEDVIPLDDERLLPAERKNLGSHSAGHNWISPERSFTQ